MTIGCILTIKCEPCSFGQHPDRRSVHPWAGPEDIAHAVREGHADPTRKPCTCWCSRPPRRIQRQRTAGWRMPEGAVYVGRPSAWGNPFRVVMDDDYRWSVVEDVEDLGDVEVVEDLGDVEVEGCGSKAEAHEAAVSFFADGLQGHLGTEFPMRYPSMDEIREALAGHDLACWCPLDQPCHADVLLELANGDH